MAHAFSRFSYYLCCLLLHNPAPGTFTTLLFLSIALLPSVIYYTPSFSSPFPLSLLYFPHPFTPHALPAMPKKCALNFYPTDLSGASWLPLKPLLVYFLSLVFYLLIFSLFPLYFSLSPCFSVFNSPLLFNILPNMLFLSLQASLPASCGDHVAGWDGVRQGESG